MPNFFTNLFETTGRGIGTFDPISLFQRITGHKEASQRTRDFISDPVAFGLRGRGHLQGAEDWQKAGGIAQTVAAAIVGSIFGAGALGGVGGGGTGSFAPGTAATQEAMGLGGLFGQGMGGTPGASAGGGLFNMGNINRVSNLQSLMQSGTGQPSSLRTQMVLDNEERKRQEEQALSLAALIDELLKTRVPRRLR